VRSHCSSPSIRPSPSVSRVRIRAEDVAFEAVGEAVAVGVGHTG